MFVLVKVCSETLFPDHHICSHDRTLSFANTFLSVYYIYKSCNEPAFFSACCGLCNCAEEIFLFSFAEVEPLSLSLSLSLSEW